MQLLRDFKNLLILRSRTKDYALTNLRLGYALTDSQIGDYLNSAITCWNVNGLAQEAGIKALKNKGFLLKSMKLMHNEKRRVEKEIDSLSYQVIPSVVNYYLLRVKNAQQATRLLLKENIYVRDCSSYGLTAYVRISIRTPNENNYLLRMLRKYTKEIRS